MNRRKSIDSSDGLDDANSKVLVRSPLTPDEPTVGSSRHWSLRQINCVRKSQWLSYVDGASDEPVAPKKQNYFYTLPHLLIREDASWIAARIYARGIGFSQFGVNGNLKGELLEDVFLL
jgi:hypothetical protein